MFEQPPVCYPAPDLALQNTSAIAAAEYGPLTAWAHFPIFSRWAPPLPQVYGASVLLIMLHNPWLPFVFDSAVAFVFHADPAFVHSIRFSPQKNAKNICLFVFLALVFPRLYGPP